MGTDYRFSKNHCFYLSFFIKVEPIISSSGKLILTFLLVEQIFRQVEICFRNHLLLCVATVTVSCKNKLLMQNLIPADIN